MISGSFAKNVLQLQASYGSSPPCNSLEDLEFTVYEEVSTQGPQMYSLLLHWS